MKQLRILILLLCWSYSIHAQPYISLDSLDRYFQKSIEDWGVPGMSIAIVEKGQMVLAKGYGVKEAGKADKVNEFTNYAIASNSKAFTSAAIAMLIDEGKLKWDDKVVDLLPGFKLADPYITAELTVRDLLCHRAGYTTFSGDLLWFETSYTREDIINRAQYLPFTYGFRERFGYSNIMYIVAGEVVAKVSGMSWDEFVTTRIINPLGMQRTTTTIRTLDQYGNYAMPHAEKEGRFEPVEYMSWDNVAAAGGINSNVVDVSKWITLQLARGVLKGDTFFSPARSREMWQAHTPLPVSAGSERTFPTTHFSAYGLGWEMKDYKGVKIIGHSGGTDGMTSYTCLVPEKDLGFTILTNAYASMYYPMVYAILDAYLGSDGTNWSQLILERVKSNKAFENAEAEKQIAARVKNTRPSLALEKYCGTYGGELYGDAQVELKGNMLMIRFLPATKLDAKLSHWHYDTFELEFVTLESLPKGKVTFILDAQGEVSEMKVDVPNPDFDFTELTFKRRK
jgi:CubicO group peptidase (beta-lactamase class C family)